MMYMSKIFNVLHFKQLEEIENKSKVEFKEIDPLDRGTASINSSNPPLEPYLQLRYIRRNSLFMFSLTPSCLGFTTLTHLC